MCNWTALQSHSSHPEPSVKSQTGSVYFSNEAPDFPQCSQSVLLGFTNRGVHSSKQSLIPIREWLNVTKLLHPWMSKAWSKASYTFHLWKLFSRCLHTFDQVQPKDWMRSVSCIMPGAGLRIGGERLHFQLCLTRQKIHWSTVVNPTCFLFVYTNAFTVPRLSVVFNFWIPVTIIIKALLSLGFVIF